MPESWGDLHPTNVVVTPQSEAVELRWSDIDDPRCDRYSIRVREGIKAASRELESYRPRARVEGLRNGVAYVFEVRGVKDSGEPSGESVPVSAVPLGPGALDALLDPEAPPA